MPAMSTAALTHNNGKNNDATDVLIEGMILAAIVVAVMLEFGLHGSRAARIATKIMEFHLKARVVAMPAVDGE